MRLTSWITIGSMWAFCAAAEASRLDDPEQPMEAPAEEEPEALPRIRYNEVSVGYTGFQRHDLMRRGARPTQGFSLMRLKLMTPQTERWPYSSFDYQGSPRFDELVDAMIVFNEGHTVLRASRERFDYLRADWRFRPESSDNATQFSVDHALQPNLGAFAMVKFDDRKQGYAAPRAAERTRTQLVGGGVEGQVLGGHVSVVAAERITRPVGGTQPTTLQRRFEAGYAPDLGPTLSLEGRAAWTRIQQSGLPNSDIKFYGLNGSLELGPATTVQFDLGRQDQDLDTIANAYVRKRLDSGLRLVHRWPKWSFQVGFRHKESERVRKDQSFVDVPKSNVYDFRLAGRMGDFGRLSIRGTWEDFQRVGTVQTVDPRQMQWDDRATLSAHLSGGNDVVSAYATYGYRWHQIRQRGVDVRWENVAMGASYVFSPAVQAFAEVAGDRFMVNGPTADGLALGDFYPDSRSASLGLTWSQSETTVFTTSLNHFDSNDVRGMQLTFGLRQALGPDGSLDLSIAPWSHRDRALGIHDYRRTIFQVRYTMKF